MTAPRFLSEDECHALATRIVGLTNQHGETRIAINSTWWNDVRWARNRVSMSGESRDTTIGITRGSVYVSLNQSDLVSLTAAVKRAERATRDERYGGAGEVKHFVVAPPVLTYPKTHIWSDATYAMGSDAQITIANQLMVNAERAGMLSAGYAGVRAGSVQNSLADGRMCYARYTIAECSMTVRDPDGTGSGWAGASSYDWNRFDPQKLADIALEKCLTSRNPVRIEPGRYTLIMEPQATFDLISWLFRHPRHGYFDLAFEEEMTVVGPPPFFDHFQNFPVSRWEPSKKMGVTKIGKRVFDSLVTFSFDPEDPDLGGYPFTGEGDPYRPVTWVEGGVLKTLGYSRFVGPSGGLDPQGKPTSQIFRMSGGTTSIEEMIATTKRGLIVTRLYGVNCIDDLSLLCTGLTRDGLWLIENGKISHPVTNLWFTESPIFVLNQVQQLGVPVPVYAPGLPAIVPPMKVTDFSFTAMMDAV